VTALAGRRRRSTLVASIAAVVAAALVVTLTVIGALTLYNSTDGADASSGRRELVFPRTPVGAIAALDDAGKLASLAVIVVQPAGTGGSIVPVPVSADSSGGAGPERLPLDETLAVQGQAALQDELGALLRLGIEDISFVDDASLATMLAPVGSLQVDLPSDVTAAGGKVVARSGATTMGAAEAAAVLTARDPAVPAVEQYRSASAVWEAVAKTVGKGVASRPAAGANGTTTTTAEGATAKVDAMFADLIAGRVGTRALRTSPVPPEQNGRNVDVSLLDPAEVLLVFGQIAPAAVSAPGSGLTFRVVSAFSADQLAGTDLTNTEVAYQAIQTILSMGGNVVSVSTSGSPPRESTDLAVSDASVVNAADQAKPAFATSVVSVDPRPIAGVDVVAALGTSYLKLLARGTPPPVPTTTTATATTAPSGTATTAPATTGTTIDG
jgi:hypothetical protein